MNKWRNFLKAIGKPYENNASWKSSYALSKATQLTVFWIRWYDYSVIITKSMSLPEEYRCSDSY